MIIAFLLFLAADTAKVAAPPATAQSLNVIDSVMYYINLTQPDSFHMKANCSLDPEARIEVIFSKTNGLSIKSKSMVSEVVRGALLLTGIGTPQYWQAIKINNVTVQDNKKPGICYATIIPKDSSLFTKATIKVRKNKWKIEEAKISTADDEIVAKLIYNKMGMPISIDVVSKMSRVIIKHIYNKINQTRYIPFKTTLISAFSEEPEIFVEYSAIKKK